MVTVLRGACALALALLGFTSTAQASALNPASVHSRHTMMEFNAARATPTAIASRRRYYRGYRYAPRRRLRYYPRQRYLRYRYNGYYGCRYRYSGYFTGYPCWSRRALAPPRYR